MALTDKLRAIADAIRVKTSTTELLSLDEMPVAIGGIASNIDAVIDRSISGEYVSNVLQRVGEYALRSCSNLVSISLPNLTTIGPSGFYGCSALESYYLPNLKSLGARGFELCTSLKTAHTPNLTSIASYAYQDCSSLESADVGSASTITTGTFKRCTKLACLIVRTTYRVCSLTNIDNLAETPIVNGTGYVYVPSALVDSYKIATNWSTISSQIRAIEDYPEITGG